MNIHKQRLIEQHKHLATHSGANLEKQEQQAQARKQAHENAMFWASIKPKRTRWQRFIAWLVG